MNQDNPTDPKEIKRIQRELKEQQFDPGPVDGILGQWTQKAIDYRKYSFERELPVETKDKLIAISVRHIGRLNKSQSNTLCNNPNTVIQTDQVDSVPRKQVGWMYNVNFIRSCYEKAYEEQPSPIVPLITSSKQMLENATWTQMSGGIPPLEGDVFGVYFNSLGELAHCGIILEWPKTDKFFLTVEAAHNDNYWPGKDGWPRICMKRRLKSDAFAIKRFL